MVDFEGFIPIFNGEVTPNLDGSLENSSFRTGITEADYRRTFRAAALGRHAHAGSGRADHADPAAASADHTGTLFATVATHGKAGLVRTACPQDPSAFGSSLTIHPGSPRGGVAA